MALPHGKLRWDREPVFFLAHADDKTAIEIKIMTIVKFFIIAPQRIYHT
jgi:hypothetical protein